MIQYHKQTLLEKLSNLNEVCGLEGIIVLIFGLEGCLGLRGEHLSFWEMYTGVLGILFT